MSNKKYVYLAGIIDGEGCLRFNNAPRLHIANTSPILIKWLITNFKGYTWTENKVYIPNSKQRYTWELSAQQLLSLLIKVEPYLLLKRRQANLIISYYKHAITQYELRKELQRLNHKGLVNKHAIA